MKQLGKSSKFEYTVEPFTEDFTGVLAWQELGKRILAAAGMHADSHGFGMKQLMPQNMAWVLSRMTISMNEMPKVNEKYAVDTWIRNIYRTFTDRCFAILRPDNTAYGYAYTTWALINMETRMPVNLENLPDGGFAKWIDDEKICQVSDNSRIRVKESEPSRVITAYYSDIDITATSTALDISSTCSIFSRRSNIPVTLWRILRLPTMARLFTVILLHSTSSVFRPGSGMWRCACCLGKTRPAGKRKYVPAA